MNIDAILDGKIHIEGQTLPTVREIIEQHFVVSAGGNAALGKMIAAQYVAYVSDLAGPEKPREQAGTTGAAPEQPRQEQPAADETPAGTGFRVGPDAEALLKSIGVPLTADGRIDIVSAVAGAFTPEGAKTPLGTLFGTVMRAAGDPGKPRA